jgi:hypothetical protein
MPNPPPFRDAVTQRRALGQQRCSMTALAPAPDPTPGGSPPWVHRYLPRSAPPAARRALRSARVPPMDYGDDPLYIRPGPTICPYFSVSNEGGTPP